jgi:hypothetical protein
VPLMFDKFSVKVGGFIPDFGQVLKATDVVERLCRDLRFDRNDLKLLGKKLPE